MRRSLVTSFVVVCAMTLAGSARTGDASAAPLCNPAPSAAVNNLILSGVGFCFYAPTSWVQDYGSEFDQDNPLVRSTDSKQSATLQLLDAYPGDFAAQADRAAFGFARTSPGFTIYYPVSPLLTTGADVAYMGVDGYQLGGVRYAEYVVVGQYGEVSFTFRVTLTSDYVGIRQGVGLAMANSLQIVNGIPPPVFHIGLHGSHRLTIPGYVHDVWLLTWWFDCSATPGGDGLFSLFLYNADGTFDFEKPNPVYAVDTAGNDSTVLQYGGNFAFQVITECQWGITVY